MANGKKAMDAIGLKYFFTMHPQVNASPVGDIPGGYRVDFKYTGSVETSEEHYAKDWKLPRSPSYKDVRMSRAQRSNGGSAPARGYKFINLRAEREKLGGVEWFGLDGVIASGSDWVTVRHDGVATFDGRITIKADESFLVDAVISGVVDLRDPATMTMPSPDEKRSSIFDRWLLGDLVSRRQPAPGAAQVDDQVEIWVVLPVRFEASRVAGSWAKEDLAGAAADYWKYERLVRGQFVAVGTVKMGRGRFSPIGKVTLDVYETCFTPPPPAPNGGKK